MKIFESVAGGSCVYSYNLCYERTWEDFCAYSVRDNIITRVFTRLVR